MARRKKAVEPTLDKEKLEEVIEKIEAEESEEVKEVVVKSKEVDKLTQAKEQIEEFVKKAELPLVVELTTSPRKILRIWNTQRTHCFSRVQDQGTYLEGQFLSSIPSQFQAKIAEAFKSAGVLNRNGVYLSASGVP
jgi:hypothetical protein